MNSNLRAAIVAAGLVGMTFSTGGIASAATPGTTNSMGAPGVTLNPGEVALGYSDGYWDHSHAWHAWRNQDDMQSYKSAQNTQFHDWKHSRDPDQGWTQQ